ncbi:glycoside hydrolase superfamily [Lineolata rhizophorae]|uniref:mannan endo-1,4-beta-mannosidase n=1 Tax=Lineolata rhizophorae TaxID=578093 RepID=A0A6A6NQI7_9PEZI|nr:glycoside hydrolase superfamily [Lineolata rhizophorae]
MKFTGSFLALLHTFAAALPSSAPNCTVSPSSQWTSPTSFDRSAWVVRNGTALYLSDGTRWTGSGPNIYWLGLDENVVPPADEPYDAATKSSYPTKGRVTEMMNVLNVMGANHIRAHTLGVSFGNPLALMPERGVINEDAWEAIDWAVYQAGTHGIRLSVPLVDNYDYYHGGKFNFLRWRGIDMTSSDLPDDRVQLFYTDPDIISDFKFYINALLTHMNPYTGLTYADDPTIFAYETGNELGGPVFQDKAVPVAWTREIAQFVKELAPRKLVVDGTYGVKEGALAIEEVDIYSNHYYPVDNAKLSADLETVGEAGKVYFAGEYDWSDAGLDSWLSLIEERQGMDEPVIAGDQFWSLFGHDVPDCSTFVPHDDGQTMHYNNPANTPEINGYIARVRQHFFTMNDQAVALETPEAPCPGPTCS